MASILDIPEVIALDTDNAAMIALAGTWAIARGERGGLDLSVDPGLPLV